ncbi:unnamed protein product [Ectocarpus sp. CCAP 1310/34]|nr:unnamed protein product [Ectocarpus sp. CCAP 1310/34]
MDETEATWERFVSCKSLLTQFQHFQTLQQGGGFGGILSSSSSNANSETSALIRELTVRPVSNLLSDEAVQGLAKHDRLVDFIQLVLRSRSRNTPGTAARVQEIAVVGIKVEALGGQTNSHDQPVSRTHRVAYGRKVEAIHSGLVVDKPAQELQNVLLAELGDISPDHAPAIVNAVLAPLLEASKRQFPEKEMSEEAAASFLVVLDILPKVLSVTAGVPALSDEEPVPEKVRGLSGAQYKDRVVSCLFRARWPGAVSVGMCQTLRDLDLGERHLSVAVSRVLRHLRKNAKLHDLPALTYQLLLLAGRGCKEAALEGVIQVFNRLDAEAADREDAAAGAAGGIPIRPISGGGGGGGGGSIGCGGGGGLGTNSTEELRFVEGTILLHFNFAMKQDHSLASCVLKGFQRRAAAAEVGRAFTPFRLALLLSLSRIQRFQQPVLDLVEEIVSDCLVYDHLREGSAWLESEEEAARGGRRWQRYGGAGAGAGGGRAEGRDGGGGGASDGEDGVGGGGGGGGGGSSSSAKAVERVLLTVVAFSRGWDHLVDSLLRLGLRLLDRGGGGAAGVSSSPGAVGASRGMLEKLQGAQSHRAALRASYLGRVVLMETFKTHEVVRDQVLSAVLEQVTARSQGVLGYVKLLGLLVQRYPNLLLGKAAAVQDVFGYISVLPPTVAERFLQAVSPLMRLRPGLQDSVVLPLRKALFSREERARLVAVGGLVLLLKAQSRNAAAVGGRGGLSGGSNGGTQMSQTSQMSEGQQVAMALPFPQAAGSGGGGSALSLAEGFGLLRRCLTQQMVVRAKLYDGLLSCFVQGWVDSVSLLVGHLRRFVSLPPPVDGGLEGTGPRNGGGGGSGSGGGSPLLLGRCLDSAGDIVEPLPLLLGCLHRMLVAGRESLTEHAHSSNSSLSRGGGAVDPENMLDDDDGDGPLGPAEAAAAAVAGRLRETLNKVEDDLRRLSAALSGCPLSEFDLDKVADFSPSGGLAARTKLATAALLCGSYEALMQGSLLLPATVGGQRSAAAAAAVSPVHGCSKLPTLASVQGVLRLFDCRQALLDLVRPSLPTAAQQRPKKGNGGAASNSNSSSNGLWGESESSSGGGGGQPGFSAAGCFGLTLYPGGMPCLGLVFVEDMLAVLNVDASSGEETEGDTERDPGQIEVDLSGDGPPTEVGCHGGAREDLGLQRLALETCRGHLRCLRAGAAQPSSGGGGGLAVDVGGGPSAVGVAGGVHGGGPRDEADAGRAGKAAVKRCAVLAPLLLKEFFRQVTTGNTSGAVRDAAAAAKASKGKGKSGGGDKGTKKKTSSAPSESLAEVALSCFEECVCIAAHCSPQKGTAASRTAKMLAAAYDSFPDSNVAPADPAAGRGGSGGGGGAAVAAGVLGRHAEGLVNTFVSLVGGEQIKEAETVCRILSQLSRLLRLHPKSLETHGASLKRVCEQQNIKCPGLAKAVAHMSMKSKGGRIAALHDLARQVSACLGPREEDEEEDDEPPVVTFQVINNFTMNAINDVTVGTVQACIGDVEYALRLLQKAALARQARVSAQTPEGMRSLLSRGGGRGGAGESQSSGTASEASDDDDLNSDDGSCADFGRNSDSDEDAAGIRSDGGVGERDPLDRRETLVCDRLRVVMNALTVLLASKMPGRSVEKLVSSATRVFRTMTKVLKVRLSLKKAYIGAGLKHVLATKQGFTKALQELLPNLNGEDETTKTKNKMTKNNVTKNSITRQSRLVPALIFQIEECDVQLLLLGKLCKGSLDLPKWVTSRVDRDFRINQKVVAECQEEVRASRQKRKREATGKKKKDTGSAKKKKDAKQNKAKQKAARRRRGGGGSGSRGGRGGRGGLRRGGSGGGAG